MLERSKKQRKKGKTDLTKGEKYYMRPPVWRMPKKEIVQLAKWRCVHGESGLSHYNCFLREHPDVQEKTGFLDIETSNLHATFGIILSYSIKERGVDNIYSRVITAHELRTCLDKNVVMQCVRDMQKFDRVITFYGTRFDLPFIRTRALALGIDFPEYGQLYHKDIYYIARNKLRLHSNRLDAVCRALFGDTTKTRIEPQHWIQALMGKKEALDYILEHNRQDVIELERVYDTLICFNTITNTSI
jgi:uncharacterized protein YprB with RNaseH-like and TPR domain